MDEFCYQVLYPSWIKQEKEKTFIIPAKQFIIHAISNKIQKLHFRVNVKLNGNEEIEHFLVQENLFTCVWIQFLTILLEI